MLEPVGRFADGGLRGRRRSGLFGSSPSPGLSLRTQRTTTLSWRQYVSCVYFQTKETTTDSCARLSLKCLSSLVAESLWKVRQCRTGQQSPQSWIQSVIATIFTLKSGSSTSPTIPITPQISFHSHFFKWIRFVFLPQSKVAGRTRDRFQTALKESQSNHSLWLLNQLLHIVCFECYLRYVSID